MSAPFPNAPKQKLRRGAAVAIVAAVALGILLWSRRQPESGNGSGSAGISSPSDRVTAMLAAEKAGDVATYLDCFAGELRQTIVSRMGDKPDEELAAQLRGGAAKLTGHAVTDVEIHEKSNRATLQLERIYPQYNETHRVQFEWGGGEWKIVEMTPIERSAPEIPYGTPVYVPPQQDEGAQSSEPQSAKETEDTGRTK